MKLKRFEQFDFTDDDFDEEEYDQNYDHRNWKVGDTIICIKEQKYLIVGKSYTIYSISFDMSHFDSKDISIVYLVGNDGYLHWCKIKTNGEYNFAPKKLDNI